MDQHEEGKQRKKRKWDVAAPFVGPPVENVQKSTEKSSSVIQAALEAVRKSPLPVVPGSSSDPQVAAQIFVQKLAQTLSSKIPNVNSFEKEFEINDFRPDVRYLLCKSTTHDEIMNATHSVVKIRGKYVDKVNTSKEASSPNEKPLHLFITAENQQDLNAAIAKIQDLIASKERKNIPLSPSGNIIHKVFVGMENCESSFNLVSRILGPKGQFIKHIATTTNVKVFLKGSGSGYTEGPEKKESTEPLHIFISGDMSSNVSHAISLAENLIAHVKQEYQLFSQNRAISSVQTMPTAPMMSYHPQQYYSGMYYGYPGGAYPVTPTSTGIFPQYPPPYFPAMMTPPSTITTFQSSISQPLPPNSPQQSILPCSSNESNYSENKANISTAEKSTLESLKNTSKVSGLNTESSNMSEHHSNKSTEGHRRFQEFPNQARSFEDNRRTNDLPGPKLPNENESFSYYEEVNLSNKTSSNVNVLDRKRENLLPIHFQPAGSKVTSKRLSKDSSGKSSFSEKSEMKLVDYDEADSEEKNSSDTEAHKATKGNLPFWARPSAIDGSGYWDIHFYFIILY